MIYPPHMFDGICTELTSLKPLADQLHSNTDWPVMYDLSRYRRLYQAKLAFERRETLRAQLGPFLRTAFLFANKLPRKFSARFSSKKAYRLCTHCMLTSLGGRGDCGDFLER